MDEDEVRAVSRLLLAAYSTLLGLLLTLSAPFWLSRLFFIRRYREGLPQRLGLLPASLRAGSGDRRTIWVHAVSVGEVLAVEHLIAELRQAFPARRVVVSTTTATGQALARARFRDLPVFFYPLDLVFAVRQCLRAVEPELLVLVESELWPRMLYECALRGTKVVVVNARVSDRSYRRTLPFRRIWCRLTAPVQLFLAQGEETAGRLRRLGVADERIRSPGNLKYDFLPAEARESPDNAMTQCLAKLLGGGRLVVCGSTHPGEEAMLLEAWPAFQRAVPDAVLLLAPRHPERFAEVEHLLRATGAPWFRCSHLLVQVEPILGGTLLLLDTIGDLRAVYGLATAAFIGGSLVARGGHNPLEATQFGIPVLIGPSYENFREIIATLLQSGAVRVIEQREIAQRLAEAMELPTKPKPFTGASGSTARTITVIQALLERP